MTGDPLVSVVIPAYRSECTLGAALSGALTQTYPRVEIIVCIDGEYDRSGAIADAHGELVRVVRQENAGVAAARNAAVEASSGELIALLDADDVWLPPHVERAVARWKERVKPRSYVTCNAYVMGAAGIVTRRTVLPTRGLDRSTEAHRLALLQRNIVSGMALYPRVMHDEIGGFDPEMVVLEDYDFWVRAAFAGWTTLYETRPSVLYRRTGTSLSVQGGRMAEYEHRLRERVRMRYGDRLTDAERDYLDRVTDMETHDVYLHRGDVALREGRRRDAAREYAAASSLVPSDRGLRLKAAALAHVPPAVALYAWRERVRAEQTSRV